MGLLVTLRVYIRKKERSKINYLSFCLRKFENCKLNLKQTEKNKQNKIKQNEYLGESMVSTCCPR